MNWASNPVRCPCLWLLRQKDMIMSEWRIVSKLMKLLLELDSFGNSTPWLLHTKLPRTITVLSDCGHCYKMGQTAIPSVLPDPTVKASCFLCSGPGWDLDFPVLPEEGKSSGGCWDRPSKILRVPKTEIVISLRTSL